MYYEGIMDMIMKTLCVLGISSQHNVNNLNNRQNCTSAVAQVNVHNLPNARKVPNAQPVRSRLCQIRLHHVFANSPKLLGPAWQVWTSYFFGTWFWWIRVNCSLAPVTALARIAQTGSNVARWFYLLHCARDARVCWDRTNIFWFMVCQTWRPKPIFPLIIIWDSFKW